MYESFKMLGIPIEENIFSLDIDSEYAADSFVNEYVISRKWDGYDGKITYEKGLKNDNRIIIDMPLRQAAILKKSIELLTNEYKMN